MATVATDPTTMAARDTVQILARLPNELLSTICSWLPTPDVRVLGHVNRWFQNFTADYLRVYQYKSGLFRLPDAVLFTIAHGLYTQDHSRFARMSQKLYPKLMRPLIAEDVKKSPHFYKCKSLFFAARTDNVELARKVVSLGADVNNSRGFATCRSQPWKATPLATAIFNGRELMVRWLLEAGARMSSHGEYNAFWSALDRHHEKVLCILLEDPRWSEQFYAAEALFLRACENRMANFMRVFLEKRRGEEVPEDIQHKRSLFWAYLLQDSGMDGYDDHGKVSSDVYQISSLLLEHGCDPGAESDSKSPRY